MSLLKKNKVETWKKNPHMDEIDSTTNAEPEPSDKASSAHDSVSANRKTYRFNPQWLKTFNWLV
jgi:hypothetical protein